MLLVYCSKRLFYCWCILVDGITVASCTFFRLKLMISLQQFLRLSHGCDLELLKMKFVICIENLIESSD